MSHASAIDYAEAHLSILGYLEAAYGGNSLTQADVNILFAPWVHDSGSLLTAALDLLTAVLPCAHDDPLQFIANMRGHLVELMAGR